LILFCNFCSHPPSERFLIHTVHSLTLPILLTTHQRSLPYTNHSSPQRASHHPSTRPQHPQHLPTLKCPFSHTDHETLECMRCGHSQPLFSNQSDTFAYDCGIREGNRHPRSLLCVSLLQYKCVVWKHD
jgi:hypothetical protein